MNEQPAFTLAVVHEGFFAGVQAIVTMDPLLAELRAEFDIQTRLWDSEEFDLFPELFARATQEMVEADVIVISAQTALSEPIERWIEYWAPRKRGMGSALVALIGPDVSPRQEASLRQAARNGAMNFFCAAVQPGDKELAEMPRAALLNLPAGR